MTEFSSGLPVRPIPSDARRKEPEVGMALCLSGGGYRAMLFHVGAILRLNECGALSRLKRISSVSGGSITAGVLGMNWKQLRFDPATGIAADLGQHLVEPVRALASRTIDAWSIVVGGLLPGISASDRVAAAYDKHIFKGATLAALPADVEGPRFVINATNVQTGSLWRFSRPYMGDWQVGLIRHPKILLAQAVAASSAFPPVLSPCQLDVSTDDFDAAERGPLFRPPYNEEIVLSDGGVYDNLGLETAFKRYKTVLVSDGGKKMDVEAEPDRNWAGHSMRVVDVIDNQVRSLRKRSLIDAYNRKLRDGTYWGIASHFFNYDITDVLGVALADTARLAAAATRLERMETQLQEQIINWGYAICEAALRKWCAETFVGHGLLVGEPVGWPYPTARL